MASLNKVILVGNLGDNPESRPLASGDQVVNFRLATSEAWKDRNGDTQERTEWHRVVIFDEILGKLAKSSLRKGSKVYLQGQVQTRKWTDTSGQDKYSTEVVLKRFRGELVLLDNDDGEKVSKPEEWSRTPPEREQVNKPAPFLDDDVPF